MFSFLLLTGACAPEEDELYERGVVESNCVYRLVENKLVPHEQAWASIPSITLLASSEVWASILGSLITYIVVVLVLGLFFCSLNAWL